MAQEHVAKFFAMLEKDEPLGKKFQRWQKPIIQG